MNSETLSATVRIQRGARDALTDKVRVVTDAHLKGDLTDLLTAAHSCWQRLAIQIQSARWT